MKRAIFNSDHEIYRSEGGKFLDREAVPHYDEWERAGSVSREAWLRAGEAGLLCPWLPEQYGGSEADFVFSVVLIEELCARGLSAFGCWIHSDIIVPYLWSFGTEEQKQRWLPGCASGQLITAVAMTEPDAGSDLQSLRATAVRDGDHYVLNGQKTFISNGLLNDLVIVAAKTEPRAEPAHRGVSLFVVEQGMVGYPKGRRLEKIGWHAQDTAELSFEDCRVPLANRLGEEGQGFVMLMKQLPKERLVCSLVSLAGAWRALALTREYIRERKAFGRPLAAFQNTRFRMAEMYTEAEVLQSFLDRLVMGFVAGGQLGVETAMAKYLASDAVKRITDQCLQFFGGYGYMEEYAIARAWRDVRVHSIFAGANEILKELVARAFLDR